MIEFLDAQDLIVYLSFASLLVKMTAIMGLYFFLTLYVNNQSQQHSRFSASYDAPIKKPQKAYNETNPFVHWLARRVRRIESSDECPASALLENKTYLTFQGGQSCHKKQKKLYPLSLSGYQSLQHY